MTINAPPKPKKNQQALPDEIQGRDLFSTPNYATKLLIPFIPKNITHVWECAAGGLKISKVLKAAGYKVLSTDIKTDVDGITYYNFVHDILRTDILNKNNYVIITNPPYSLKKQFINTAIEYNVPFAFLIPFDMSGFMVECFKLGMQGIVPSRRINYITPTGLSEKSGHTSYYHSFWFTWKFELKDQLTFVDLTNEMREDI